MGGIIFMRNLNQLETQAWSSGTPLLYIMASRWPGDN